MPKLRRLLSIIPVLVLSAPACGGLSGQTDHPSTLATIVGEIRNPDNVPLDSSAFRVAIIWLRPPAASDGGQLVEVAEDIAVTPVFPAQFHIDLTQLPPREAMFGAGGAIGGIVAYEDLNNNGKLDLVDPNAPQAIDRVVGVQVPYHYADLGLPPIYGGTNVLYVEDSTAFAAFAGLVDDNGARLSLGFQFLEDEALGPWACSGGPRIYDEKAPDPSCPGLLIKPINTPVTLALSNDPELSSLICRTRGGQYTFDSATHPPGTYPSPMPQKSDGALLCSPDGQRLLYITCTAVASKSLCDVDERCRRDDYSLGTPAPSDWPCPTK
jgi:hypothetical protein